MNTLTFDGDPIEMQPGTINALADRRRYTESRLQELKNRRGVALLDNEAFTGDDEIAELEIDLDAIRVAEGEATSRKREALEVALEKRRDAARDKVREFERLRLDAVEAAHSAAIGMMVALRDVQTYSEKLDRELRSVGVVSLDTPPEGINERFSRRLTAVMRPLLTNGGYEYGSISFPGPLDCWAGEWRTAEEKLLAPAVKKALQPTYSNK